MKRLLLTLAVSTVALTGCVTAPAANDQHTEEVVRALLKREPGLVRAALEAEAATQEKQRVAGIEARMRPLAAAALSNTDGTYPTYGSETLGPTIVEAMDYNCGYCKRFHAEGVKPLLEGGQPIKVRIVFHPILSPGSNRMAELAAAAHLMGHFQAAHVYLLGQSARDVAEADALIPGMAKAMGVEPAAVELLLASGRPAALLKKHTDQTSQLGAGTPAIWINDRLIPGFIDAARLAQELAMPAVQGGS